MKRCFLFVMELDGSILPVDTDMALSMLSRHILTPLTSHLPKLVEVRELKAEETDVQKAARQGFEGA